MLPTQDLFPMLNLRQGIDRLFEDFFETKGMAPFWTEAKGFPAIDVKETEDALLVDAELPGLKQNEIEVKVEEGVLSIAAERKQEKDEKTRKLHRLERHYGRMERRLALPATVDGDKVEATYKDGVLHVLLPKKAGAKAKTVPVKSKS